MALSTSSALHPSLAPILNTVLDAVVVLARDGRVMAWNSVSEAVFGWTEQEAAGQKLSALIIPEQHREAHEIGLARLNEGCEPRVLNRRIEITAVCRDGREIPVELSITTAQTGTDTCFVGFLRDITERRNAEALLRRQALETKLLFEIAHMAAASESFDESLERALLAICELTSWPVGHAFVVPSGSAATPISTSIWVETRKGVADEIKAATQETTFASGEGLPGMILQTGEPLWVADTDRNANFPRKGLGFRGAFGFPLKSEGKTVAILEFFSVGPKAPDPGLLQTVRALGDQVGRVFERKKTEERQQLLLNELSHRVKNILTIVQAVAHLTFHKAADLEAASAAFNSRVRALADAQSLLVDGQWRRTSLRAVIEAALSGCGDPRERARLCGPDIEVSATNAMSISLAVHELCTNALKYGALSNEQGIVDIDWGYEAAQGNKQFFFEWRERGGPPIVQPLQKGFGTHLLERGLARDLGGEVHLEYASSGFHCRFTAPIPQ